MAEYASLVAPYFRVLFCLCLVYSTAGSCDETALGMANGYIFDSDITSSSVHNSSTPSKNGRLNYTAGSSWCATASDTSPYLQIDLGIRHIICAVATQGNSQADQWLKKYKLQFSTDNTTWHEYKERGAVKIFLGNLDRRTIVKHMLFAGIDAQYLRILSIEYHVGACFRVELYGMQVKQENLALHKPTSQSSTSGNFVSSNAVDGNRNTQVAKCTHTVDSTTDPWWRVDLENVESVSQLYIVNRGDCCGNRLSGFQIRVGNTTTGGGVSNHLCGDGLSVPQGKGKLFQCKPVAHGRYVYIRIPGSGKTLTLCEVEVYGMANLALKQPALQSSNLASDAGLARLAVDGGISTNWGDKTCTHTQTESNPWWRVDLGSSFPVAEIFIVNRDCGGDCGNRFKGFEIRIGNIDERNGGTSNPQCGTGLLDLDGRQKKSFFCLPRRVGRYVYIRIPGSVKTLTICELEVYTRLRKFTACSTEPVGIADSSVIPDHRFSTSSFRSGNEPYKGRLRGSSAWFPSTSANPNDYLQIDLGSVYFVCAVATQGNPSTYAWTTKYKIETSLNNVNWTTYMEDNTEKIFDGNNDRRSIIKWNLNQSPAAKFVRFYPRGYSGNKALRVEVYGTLERCQASLGMEDEGIPDTEITVSSHHDSGHSKSSSRLYSSSSWCSSTSSISEYLQVDLGHLKTVTGVAIQGDPSSNKWVTKYKILYGYDGKTWVSDALYQGLTGNTDKSSVVVNWFSSPFAAQFVKVVPLTWNTAVCLRVDFYGCDHFIVPFLNISELVDVTLPTKAVDSAVDLRVKAEFSSQRPAKFSWSNNGNPLLETASVITVKYAGAVQTWYNFHCVRRSLIRRDIYCNTTYSCSVSVPDIPGLTKVVQANVTALLNVPRRPSVQVTQGDIKARMTTVTWTQPTPGADEAPISYFTLQYTDQSFTSTLNISSPSTKSKQLTNLKPYTDYSVKMKANSVLGNGLWGVTKLFKTSTAEPEVAPILTNVTALSSQSIHIEWQKPDLSKVNGPLTKYIVVYKEKGESEKMVDIDKSRTSQTLGNLKKWTVYKIQLRVNNGDYDGPSSVEKEVRTLEDAPSAPQDLVITEQPPSERIGPVFTVTWKKPAEENGMIKGYKLQYSYILDSKSVSGQYNLSDAELSHNFTVLGGIKYTVRVSAETIKPGPQATKTKQVATYKPSISPQGITRLMINETTYNITWQPLSREKSNGGILTYEVKRSESSTSRRKRSLSPFYRNTTATFFVLSNLKVCTRYQVEVRAYTAAGPGSFGATDHPVETSAPVAPTSLKKLSQTKRSVKLKWKEPVIGDDKQTFTIMCSGTKDYYTEFKDVRAVSSIQTTEYALKDLYPGTKYEFSVSATSRCGVGDNSSVVSLETEADAPVAPDDGEIANVTTPETTANVTLRTAPQNNGPISNYQVIVFRVKDWTDTVTEAGNSAPDYNESIENKLDYYVTAQFPAESLKPPWLFVVGNDELYGGFKNAELSRGQKYKVFNRAITKDYAKTLYGAERLVARIDVEQEDKVGATVNDPSTGAVSAGVIAAVVVIIIILVLVGIIGGVLFRKRRRQAEGDPTLNLDKARSLPMVNVSSNNLLLNCDAPETRATAEEVPAQNPEELEGPIYSNVQPDDGGDEEIKPVPVDRFAEYITGLRRGKDSAMKKQYKRLNNGQLFSWDVAKKPENKVKNRYGNIIAYDHSRIVLPLTEQEHSDYINANYLHGYDGVPKTYIACQGPVTGTFYDFWRMVWLEKPGIIVMLTNLIENGRVKCHQYWPEDRQQYGDITVINHKSETFADYVVRSFIVTKSGTNEKRHVRQFHFLVWPDKGVPQHATAVLGLRRKVRALHSNSKCPLLVHCSAGIGRTGAFILIDAMLESAKRKNVVDVFNYVQIIRNDRISMVQTEEQYVFIYMAILEALTCGNTEIPTQDMRIVVKKLSAVNPETRLSGFESEFQRLELITSADITERKDDAGRKSDNASKNRFPNIVPLNESRVMLKNSADKNYINASFVDAFRERDAFIVTQAPLKNTRADFWQMIWDYDIGTVVMLNELKEQGQAYPVYWPNEGSATFDRFTVEAISEEIFHDFTERIFKLSSKEGSQPGRQVRHYQVTGWPEKGVLANLKGVLDLADMIERSQRKCGTAPVVVQCSNGVGRSGTLCAVLSILDRLKSEQVLDIFQAVKVLRLKRPGAVETTAQYVFCYNVVQKYLDSFDNYANFT